ncbi:hypothetical protein [Hansschlegelia sp. KR7-227]|uniref:hypothetical protein n=1 Tax=Hansschlegelia sp. KR7-227 TaxID=3400914 RepID=UPI003BFDCCB2
MFSLTDQLELDRAFALVEARLADVGEDPAPSVVDEVLDRLNTIEIRLTAVEVERADLR